MKVLFIQNIEGIAGSEKYFLQLIPRLKAQGVEVEFCSVYLNSKKSEYEEFQELLDKEGIKSHSFSTKKYYNPSLLIRLKKFFKNHKFDIVHSHLIYADFWIASLRKMGSLKKVKTLSTLHGYQEKIYVDYCLKPEELPKNLYYRIASFSYKYLDKVYACSHGLKKFYDGSGINFPKGIDVIQHGFDYPDVEEDRTEHSGIILSIIGRVIPRKGHILFLEEFKSILEKYPDTILRIVGDGSDLESVKSFVKENGLEKNVEFTGFQSNVHFYYENSDIILVPSYAEGLPLVIFEAYNHSKPVVAFKTIGPEEAILDGETGFVANPFDSKEFASKVLKLMENEEIRIKMGKRAKQLLDEHFNLDRMTKDTLSYYKSLS